VVGIDSQEGVGDMLVEEVGDCRCYSMVDELVEVVLDSYGGLGSYRS
jgi:hypothetical protein